MSKKSGFTLVELLVVISIIAILSVVGITLFSGVQRNARDARRRADIDAIAVALESKKVPGAVYYSTIADTDMSSGKIPMDSSSTLYYCIKLYETDDGARLDPDPSPASWTASCLDGFFIANTEYTNGFDLATRFPANAKKSWKLCARLEAGSVYCKNSSQ